LHQISKFVSFTYNCKKSPAKLPSQHQVWPMVLSMRLIQIANEPDSPLPKVGGLLEELIFPEFVAAGDIDVQTLSSIVPLTVVVPLIDPDNSPKPVNTPAVVTVPLIDPDNSPEPTNV